jgi:hypothetical protein
MESRTKTPYEMLLINRLAKITDHPIVQGAGPINVIGIGSHEDCGNRVPSLDEVAVEFGPGHRRHVDVGDQAGRFAETRGREEIGCRRESLGAQAHNPANSAPFARPREIYANGGLCDGAERTQTNLPGLQFCRTSLRRVQERSSEGRPRAPQ